MTGTSRTPDPLTRRLGHPRYPRSNGYDARWTIENQMGPHALWLLEWLAPALGLDRLPPGARVLDLGCGRAMTSVFLAREYGLQVVAADLWVKPDDDAVRIAEGAEPPAHLADHWDPGFWAFHSADWWHHWLPDGWRDWLLWSEVCAEESPSEFMAGLARDSVDLLNADRGRLLGSTRVVGRRI
ncbi:hypothetical protein [Streptomyces sp. NPDC005890]|uniref:hypothetical protein n=1 Tax=Streptomyces sp. NPDC005890 TaxID=3154568 RepID=UPI0033E051F6